MFSRRAAAPRKLAPGDAVGPYVIDSEIGEGGMGTVYRAHRADGTDEAVALKVVKAELAGAEEHLRRFRREARAAATVQHPHLVAVLDAGEDEGRMFIAMRHVEGRSLADRVRAEGPLEPVEAARICRRVAAALDALHAAGIVHRDVKSSNILLGDDGAPVLTDFGLARGSGYSVVTAPGRVVGSLDYLAPEVIRGAEPSPAADVYALGCVVFEMLAGRPPFGHLTGFEVGMAHLEDAPPDPLADREDSPPDLGAAVAYALDKDPERRPPTATAFARMLSVALGDPAG